MTVEALAELRTNLEAALKDYRELNATLGSVEALHAACLFLTQIGIEPRLLVPLGELLAKTSDVKRTGATKPLDESLRMATAVADIDILVQESRGIGLKNAIRLVCKEMGGDISDQTMLNFRKQLGKSNVRPEVREHYDRTKQSTKQHIKNILLSLGPIPDASDRSKVIQTAILYAVRQTCFSGKKE